MNFDYKLLKQRIIEKFAKNYNFADKMGLTTKTLSFKLNNKAEWKQAEIFKAVHLLEIEPEEIDIYFFQVER